MREEEVREEGVRVEDMVPFMIRFAATKHRLRAVHAGRRTSTGLRPGGTHGNRSLRRRQGMSRYRNASPSTEKSPRISAAGTGDEQQPTRHRPHSTNPRHQPRADTYGTRLSCTPARGHQTSSGVPFAVRIGTGLICSGLIGSGLIDELDGDQRDDRRAATGRGGHSLPGQARIGEQL